MRDDVRALDLLLALAVFLDEDARRGLARYGLTLSRAHLVWEVHQRGPTTQRALAERMGVSARNVTGLVDALVATGFVTREPHPTDRRATLVTLTERGTETTEALAREQRELAHSLFGDMRDARLVQLADDLAGVLARLEQLAAETA